MFLNSRGPIQVDISIAVGGWRLDFTKAEMSSGMSKHPAEATAAELVPLRTVSSASLRAVRVHTIEVHTDYGQQHGGAREMFRLTAHKVGAPAARSTLPSALRVLPHHPQGPV